MDPTLRRDRALFHSLLAALVVLTVVFGAVAWRESMRDPELVAVGPGAVASATESTSAAEQPASSAAGGSSAASPTGGPSIAGSARDDATSSESGRVPTTGTTLPLDAAAGAALAPGEEIVVGSVVSESGPIPFDSVADTLRAYFAQLNADGGINGHPVRLVLYDDGLDPARAREAFRRLVEDDHVVAIVGSFSPLGEAGAIPELEAAGVPMIPASGLSANAFVSPIAYFLTSSLANYGLVACHEALRQGHTRVAFVYVDSELIEPILGPYEDCIEANGGAVLREPVQLGQPDYTATVLRLREFGAQLIFHEIAQSATLQLWQTMDRQGFYAPSQLVPGSDKDFLRDYTGRAGEGASIQTTVLPPSQDAPEIARMRAAIDRFSPGTALDSLAVDKWVGCLLFTQLAQTLGDDVDRATLLEALGRVQGFTGNGLINDVSYGPDKRTGSDLFWFFEKHGTTFGPVGPPRGPSG